MPRLLTASAVLLIGTSTCCCCCDAWTWVVALLTPGRPEAAAAGAAWRRDRPEARQVWGGVVAAEPTCLGEFAWAATDGREYWEITYDVDGEKADGTATLQVAEQDGRWVVLGASLAGAGATLDVGEHLDRESSDHDWDD